MYRITILVSGLDLCNLKLIWDQKPYLQSNIRFVAGIVVRIWFVQFLPHFLTLYQAAYLVHTSIRRWCTTKSIKIVIRSPFTISLVIDRQMSSDLWLGWSLPRSATFVCFGLQWEFCRQNRWQMQGLLRPSLCPPDRKAIFDFFLSHFSYFLSPFNSFTILCSFLFLLFHLLVNYGSLFLWVTLSTWPTYLSLSSLIYDS
jgi:hypothetical protein